MEMDEYVNRINGINILTRRKMQRAFESDTAATELYALINKTPENHIIPTVRERLREFWGQNFNIESVKPEDR